MYFMWFGAPILCFQILQCRSSGSGDDLTFPDGRWASQNERAHWIDSDYVRRLKIAEQAVEGAGIRNSHGGGGTLIFTSFYIHFWHQIWGETICEVNRWVPWSHPQRQASSALDAFLFRRAAHAATGSSAATLAKELRVVPRVVRAAAKCARPIWKVPQFYEVKLPRCLENLESKDSIIPSGNYMSSLGKIS